MELRRTHLRYLLAIYELGRTQANVGIVNISKALGCSKASVTAMASSLMEMGLLVRERYGKIYLTDTGFLLARELSHCVGEIRQRLPAMGLALSEEDAGALAQTIALNLPEDSRRKLGGRQAVGQ